ncbi:MAG: type II secretion system protein N [Sulfuricella sp.]
MKKSHLGYVIAASVLFLVMLLATAPASLASWLVQRNFGPAVALEQAEGGLWAGQAKALHVMLSGNPVVIPDLTWRVRWGALFKGEIALALAYGAGGKLSAGTVFLGWNQAGIENVDAVLPAELLPEMIPLMRNAFSGGELTLRSKKLVRKEGEFSGEAELVWANVGSALTSVNPLGDYRFQITGDKQRVLIRAETLRGALRFAGNGEWSMQEGLRFTGSASAEPSRRAELDPVLNLFGAADQNGNRVIAFRLGGKR